MTQLRAEGLSNVAPIQLAVADSASLQAARAAVGQQTAVLDVLGTNAGTSGGMLQPCLGTDGGVKNFSLKQTGKSRPDFFRWASQKPFAFSFYYCKYLHMY